MKNPEQFEMDLSEPKENNEETSSEDESEEEEKRAELARRAEEMAENRKDIKILISDGKRNPGTEGSGFSFYTFAL